MSALIGIAAAAGALLPMLQSREQYADEIRRAVRFRREEAAQRLRHHQETLSLRSSLFRAESDHTVAQDMQRYRIRLALSRRQSSRDAGLQHFLLNQTVSMIAGLMLGCAFCLIGQGVLPDPDVQYDNRAIVMLYTSCAGIAIGCLACAVWCSLKIQNRMTYFDHSCGLGSDHTNATRSAASLRSAAGCTRARGGSSQDEIPMPSISTSLVAPHQRVPEPRRVPPVSPRFGHSLQLYNGCRRPHLSIQDYLECHTESIRVWATLLLQIGSLAVLLGGWAFAALTLFRRDEVSKWLLFFLLAAAILGIAVGDRLYPDQTTIRDVDVGGGPEDPPLHEFGMERCLDELLQQEAAHSLAELGE